uniref:FAD synthase n=1 Tax=Trichuris muris TaxID=70415 RepID=A0A5S6R017_TRIMR
MGEQFPVMRNLYISKPMSECLGLIEGAAERFANDVFVEPFLIADNNYCKVKLCVRALKVETVTMFIDQVAVLLGPALLPNVDLEPVKDIVPKVEAYLQRAAVEDAQFYSRLSCAITFVTDCLNKYKMTEIALSFNGGKDCTVLLHILRYVLEKFKFNDCSALCVFYIKPQSTFPEVEEFVTKCVRQYGLNLLRYEGNMKKALFEFKAMHCHRKFVFLGSRATDPGHNKATKVASTDPGWPHFILLKPLLDWSYSDIWKFLRDLCIPYCVLYDQGFTSLGSKDSCYPNPWLAVHDDKGGLRYNPAYMLSDPTKERSARNL